MKVFQTLEPARARSLSILFISALAFWSGLTALLPTLPLYIQSIGGTQQQIGFVMGAFALGLLPSRLWLGPIADRKGRKIVVLIGAMVATIAPLGYLLFPQIGLLMGVRAFHGISVAAFTIGYSALVADIAPPDKRGEVIGYMSLSAPVGMALGPALGGFLQSSIGYIPLFMMSSSLGFLAWFGSNFVWEPPMQRVVNDPATEQANQQKFGFWQLLKTRPVAVPSFVMFMLGLIFGSFIIFLPLFIKSIDTQFNPGLFYSVAAISSFAVRLCSGKASDKYGRGIFITIGLLCYVVCMTLLSQTHHVSFVILAALIEGSGAGLVMPMIITMMTDRFQADQRGRIFSVSVGGFDFGMAIAGPTCGSVAEYFGYRNMFALNAGFAAIAVIVFLTLSSKSIAHSWRFGWGKEADIYAIEHEII
ncbi:MAG: MFS transporter [Microcoleaceae cyanobacterium]